MKRAAKTGTLGLAALVFFTVSGGAYGTEPLVGSLGPKAALFLLLVVPIVFALPIALAMSALARRMPEEGGYYVWAKKTLGPFWGVQQGILTLTFSLVDLAIYPSLFSTYLAYFLPELRIPDEGPMPWSVRLLRFASGALAVLLAGALNLRGTKRVSESALVGAVLVTAPFAALVALGALRGDLAAGLAMPPMEGASLVVGFSVALWNYSGWDHVSTYAHDVANAETTYRRSLLLALAFITGSYVIALVFGVAAAPDPSLWTDARGFPFIFAAQGGKALGGVVAAAAVLTAVFLLSAQLLYVPRLPAALAHDGVFPKGLAHKNRHGVPVRALALAAGTTALLGGTTFGKLVVLDIVLYGLALSLELVCLFVLLRREGTPGPKLALAGVGMALPLGCVGVVTYLSLRKIEPLEVFFLAVALVGGPLLGWLHLRRLRANANLA